MTSLKMRAIDANIGDRVTYAKWYVDKNHPKGRIGSITGFDETPRECTYIEVRWDDGEEDSIQEDGLKRASSKNKK